MKKGTKQKKDTIKTLVHCSIITKTALYQSMQKLRRHGEPPYTIAVIHGGPGAAGEMAPVGRELASGWGVLEPIQTATSLEGQIKELKNILEEDADLPVTLVGFSWGAWLSFILAADYPVFVRKLILIGSGPYEEKYAARIQETRLKRLSEQEKMEVESLLDVLNDPLAEDKSSAFANFGRLCSKADAYDPIIDESGKPEEIGAQADMFQSVWSDAAELRRSGELLKRGKCIECPVVAIHGDYDPHPAEGVQKSLSSVLKSFRFVMIRNCGHKPWIERKAREKFFRVLKEELRSKD